MISNEQHQAALNDEIKVVPKARRKRTGGYALDSIRRDLTEIFKGDKFINLVRSMDEGFCVEATDEELEKAGLSQSSSVEEDDTVDLDNMSKKQLIAFAKENDLTLPDNQKAGKEELVFHIAEQLETEE